MITLTIKKSDGSQYWEPVYFNTKEECDAWIKSEMTRSYWEKDFSTEIVETPPPEKDPIDPQKQADIDAAKDVLSKFDPKKISSLEEVSDLVMKVSLILGLR